MTACAGQGLVHQLMGVVRAPVVVVTLATCQHLMMNCTCPMVQRTAASACEHRVCRSSIARGMGQRHLLI